MMENGVEEKPTIVEDEEKGTKAADGGVALVNSVDKVVQVFHHKEESKEHEQEKDDIRGEEEEDHGGDGKTMTAEGAISQLQLVDKIVHVFHPDVTKVTEEQAEEADGDVFEEAIMDHGANSQEHANGDVNGKPFQVLDTDTFEEAVDTDLPAEDRENLVLEKSKTDGIAVSSPVVDGGDLADGLAGVKQLPEELAGGVVEELAGGVVCNGIEEADHDEGRGDSANGDDVMAVDDHDNSNELQLGESPDGVVCNGEDGENSAAFPLFVNEKEKSSADAKLASNGSCAVQDESDKEGFIKCDFLVKSTDVGKPLSAETSVIRCSETAEHILSEDVHCISSSYVVLGKSENGGSEKLDSEEKPNLNSFQDVDKVNSDAVSLSGSDKSGKSCESVLFEHDDKSSEMRHTVPDEGTFVNEVKPEIANDSDNLGASVDEGTDKNKYHPDTTSINKGVGGDTSELQEKEFQDLETKHRSGDIKDDVRERELQEVKNEHKKQDSVAVENAQDSGSSRHEKQDSTSVEDSLDSVSSSVPEIKPVLEPVQAPPRRPAGLGGGAPLFEPAPRALQQTRVNAAAPERPAQLVEDPTNGEAEENDETREKLQMIRVKFLRLAHRLGQTPHNVVVAQVLYRLGLAEQLRGRNAGRSGAFSFDRASALAEQLESAGQEVLDFSCTIMVLGKTGVGKSATINSIFDEIKFNTDAFQVSTKKVQDVVGTVQGIKVRVIDTPGLLPCWSDQRQNEKILHSVKRFIKKSPPDIVLYLDRLDMQSRDFGDLPLLRTITEIFGPSIWFNAIVVLTHAGSFPPDGPNGVSSSYEMFVTQRSHVVQQAIRQAAGDMRLMNPVSLVENHSACRTNRAGQRVLPNGQVWKPHLLLLSFASKILAEANTLLKLQDNPPNKPFTTRPRAPPLPFLLSSLLQSRPQLKLPDEQFGDEDDLDEELDESSDSEDESDFDELPPFKPLMKAQIAKLSKAQKKAYFDELEYREKLFMKKQLREEKQRRKLLKKMGGRAQEIIPEGEEEGGGGGGGASVPVAMPDFSLPASFDSDNPSHRYRFLDTSNPWLVRPVLETHGWDHDVGYEGINVERVFVVKDKIPVSFSGQATKDKKESNVQMEVASSIKHGGEEGKATSLGFDMQTIGKDMSYTLRSETRFSSFLRNKTAAGLCVTLLGDALTAGVKLEDRVVVNKRLRLVVTGGAMSGGRGGDVAYGGSLEATLRDKDHPLGRSLSTLGVSIMDWHGDLAIGCNLQSQIPIGRSSNLIARANLNNRGSGQVSFRLNSSEQVQIALVGLLPLVRKMLSLYQQHHQTSS